MLIPRERSRCVWHKYYLEMSRLGPSLTDMGTIEELKIRMQNGDTWRKPFLEPVRTALEHSTNVAYDITTGTFGRHVTRKSLLVSWKMPVVSMAIVKLRRSVKPLSHIVFAREGSHPSLLVGFPMVTHQNKK